MNKKKIALIMILLGIFLNILSLPFIQYYQSGVGWIVNMNRMEVVLIQGTLIQEASSAPGSQVTAPGNPNPEYAEYAREAAKKLFPEGENQDIYYTGRLAFLYRYLCLISVLLIFAGGVLIILSTGKRMEIK